MPREQILTRTVADRLRREITDGKWGPDRPVPSERALAARFDVSRITARRGLQQLCREGVVVARSGRGYFPVCPADSAALRQRRTIVYYYASEDGSPLLDQLHTRIINGANAEAIALGLNLFAVSRSPVDFTRALGEGWKDSLRGVLLDWATLTLADQLRQRGIPFVVVEDDIEGLPVTSVIQDNAGGTLAAMGHLASHGHRRIGIIANVRDDTHCRQRLSAYREFLIQRGLPADPGWIARVADSGGRKGMAKLLESAEPPTAVYVASRGMLAGVFDELSARGLCWPRDISLVVWGDPGIDPPPHGSQPVSYVTWSGEEMGRLAIRALEQVVRIQRSERMLLRVPTCLMDCGSVGTPGERR